MQDFTPDEKQTSRQDNETVYARLSILVGFFFSLLIMNSVHHVHPPRKGLCRVSVDPHDIVQPRYHSLEIVAFPGCTKG